MPAVESEETSFSKSEPPLPPAPRGRRFLALASLLGVGALSWIVAGFLVSAATFALHKSAPERLGALATAELEQAGEWVSGEGTPAREALSFERLGRSGSFRLARIEGRQDLWIVLPVPRRLALQSEGNELYVPPSRFVGRLISLKEAGLMLRPITQLIGERKESASGFVLLEGDNPRNHRHFLLATIALALLGAGCLSFATHLLRRVA